MTVRITARDLSKMVRHWLGCPPNGYLGSGYGSELKALLQTPMASGLADGVIAKAYQDIPLMQTAAPGSVNVYSQDLDIDKKALVFEVGGELIGISDGAATVMQDEAPILQSQATAVDAVSEFAAAALDRTINVTLPSQDYF